MFLDHKLLYIYCWITFSFSFCWFDFSLIQETVHRCDVSKPSGSLPAPLFLLRLERISSQASWSPGRSTTRGACQILLCTETLHQPHHQTKVGLWLYKSRKCGVTNNLKKKGAWHVCIYAQVWKERQPRDYVFRFVSEGKHRERPELQLYQVSYFHHISSYFMTRQQ